MIADAGQTGISAAECETGDTMAALGVVINTSTPEASVQFFQTELDKHTQLAKRSGAVLQ